MSTKPAAKQAESEPVQLLRRLYEAFSSEAVWPGSERDLAMTAAYKFLSSLPKEHSK